jgi:hypothetical protein
MVAQPPPGVVAAEQPAHGQALAPRQPDDGMKKVWLAPARGASRPKLRALRMSAVVTMFHPARPLPTWCGVSIRRARLYGSLSDVDSVAIGPRCVVCAAIDAKTTVGSGA